jgi:hypothetical protein
LIKPFRIFLILEILKVFSFTFLFFGGNYEKNLVGIGRFDGGGIIGVYRL